MKGAETQGKTNKSGHKPFITPRFSSFSLRCFSLKIPFLLRWLDFKQSVAQFLYCRRGLHKVYNRKFDLEISGRHLFHKKAEFLACRNCNYLFFPTLKEKQKYLTIMSQKRGQLPWILRKMNKEFKEGKKQTMLGNPEQGKVMGNE